MSDSARRARRAARARSPPTVGRASARRSGAAPRRAASLPGRDPSRAARRGAGATDIPGRFERRRQRARRRGRAHGPPRRRARGGRRALRLRADAEERGNQRRRLGRRPAASTRVRPSGRVDRTVTRRIRRPSHSSRTTSSPAMRHGRPHEAAVQEFPLRQRRLQPCSICAIGPGSSAVRGSGARLPTGISARPRSPDRTARRARVARRAAPSPDRRIRAPAKTANRPGIRRRSRRRADELVVAGGESVAALRAGGERLPGAGIARSEREIDEPRRDHHAQPVPVPRRESDGLDIERRIDETEPLHPRAPRNARETRRVEPRPTVGQARMFRRSCHPRSTRNWSLVAEQFGHVQCGGSCANGVPAGICHTTSPSAGS